MAPPPLTTQFCTQQDVAGLLSDEGVMLRLDDDSDDCANTTEQTRMVQAQSYGTSRVKLYCQVLYDDTDMSTSWMCNEWATIVAARWLCARRGNPIPASLGEMFKEAMEEMKAVRSGQLQIPDIGYRYGFWPVWSNISKSDGYRFMKLRVERNISERSPTQYTQHPDWGAEFSFEL